MKIVSIITYPILISGFAFNRLTSPSITLLKSDAKDSGLERELDTFFEKVAASGAKKLKKISLNDRVELTQRGLFLENEIFDVMARLNELETSFMKGDKIDMANIEELRNELKGLKSDYVKLVGADDLPLYFGRETDIPDSLQ